MAGVEENQKTRFCSIVRTQTFLEKSLHKNTG